MCVSVQRISGVSHHPLPSVPRPPPQFKNAASGKVFKMSYPCAMLNVQVAEHNTNDQFAVRACSTA